MVNAKLDRDIAWEYETMNQFEIASSNMLDEITRVTQKCAWLLEETNSGLRYLPANDIHAPLQETINSMRGKIADDNAHATKAMIERVTKSVLSDGERLDDSLAAVVDEINDSYGKVAVEAIEIANALRNPINLMTPEKLSGVLESVKKNIDRNRVNINSNLDELHKQLMGFCARENCYSNDPVNLSTGNFIYENEDLRIEGEIELSFHRYYNSLDRVKTGLGRCFLHNYDNKLIVNEDIVEVRMFDGGRKLFKRKDNGEFIAMGSTKDVLQIKDDMYIMTNLLGHSWIFDSDGNITRDENALRRGRSYSYNKEGYLAKVVTDTGAFLEYKYDQGLLVNVRDNFGRNVSMFYDSGRLAEVVLPTGATYNYQYGEIGRITEIKNARGIRAVVNTYDDKNRVTYQEFPDGSSMEFTYDDDNSVVVLRERNGSIIKYVRDDRFRNTDIIYEDGTSEHFEYNNRNQRTSIKNRNGNITKYSYDDKGNVTQIINAKGDKTNITYNTFNKIVSFKVNGKEKYKNSYDSKGNLIETIKADGSKTCFEYDDNEKPVVITNADGSKTKVIYNENGDIIQLNDASGKCIKYVYDQYNRVIKTVDSKGNATCYEYNEEGRISKSVNREGNCRSFAYNPAGMVTEITDYDGYKNSALYNEIGKVSSVTDKEGNVTTYSYDCMWNLNRVTLANGGNVLHTYNKDNRLSSVTIPEGGVIYYEYDANGNCTSVTDPEGNTTKYKYDELNRIISITDANGKTLSRYYDGEGHLVRQTNQADVSTEYTYDEEGRLLRKMDGLGFITAYEYDAMGRIIKTTYPNGTERKIEYTNNRISKHTFADGTTKYYEYDENGNCIKSIDSLGNEVHMEYNSMDKIVRVINPEGNELCYEYDAVGHVTCVTDAKNNKTRYSYTPNGNISKVVDAKGGITAYEYDCMSNLITIKRYGDNDELQITSYEWNLEGKLLKVTDPLGMSEHFEYDKCGRMIKKVDKDGYATDYAYNKLGLIENILYADGANVELCYDELRQLKQVKDATGVTSIEKDILGRVMSVTDGNGKTTGYEWGMPGEKKAVLYPDGSRVDYSYNASRLGSVFTAGGRVSYNYDELGRLNEKRLPNDIVTRYTYTPSGRIESINYKGNDFSDSFLYGYDEVGNKTSITKTRAGIQNSKEHYCFEYDELNRLVMVSKDDELLRKYEYDSFGNRTLMESIRDNISSVTKYAYNIHNQLISKSIDGKEENYRYDRRGNLIEVEANSEIIKQFCFDDANRMTMANTVIDGINKQAEYSYNFIGQRISQSIYAMGKLVCENRYTVDMTKNYNNVLSIDEISGDDIKAVKNFIWDSNVVAMEQQGIDSYYLQDDLGSTIKLTDTLGQVKESYSFDEFGNSEEASQNPTQPFGFTGYQKDDITGLYYAQARRYDSINGRFVSEDLVNGMIKTPETLNKYLYCWNRPLDYVDQNGKFPWFIPVIMAAAAACATLTGCEENTDELIQSAKDDPIEFIPEHIEYSDWYSTEHINGYEPYYNMDDYNSAEYQKYTNCYAYAFGVLKDPITGEKLPKGGLQPGYFSKNRYYFDTYVDRVNVAESTADQEVYTKLYLAGTPEANDRLVQLIKEDMDVVGMNFTEYQEGMTGGKRVALVTNHGGFHWYVYDEETGNWANKHGRQKATDRDMYFDNKKLYLGDVMTDYMSNARKWDYNFVGEYYLTRQDGQCIK